MKQESVKQTGPPERSSENKQNSHLDECTHTLNLFNTFSVQKAFNCIIIYYPYNNIYDILQCHIGSWKDDKTQRYSGMRKTML